MTRIDFYVLDTESRAQRHHYACRLAEKAWRLGHTVHVQASNMDEARELDALLWSFRPEVFIPHDISPAPKHTAVHIGYGDDAGVHHGLLVNLCDNLPAAFSRFERVAEIVTQTPEVLSASRQRYRLYRDRGYEIANHRIEFKATP